MAALHLTAPPKLPFSTHHKPSNPNPLHLTTTRPPGSAPPSQRWSGMVCSYKVVMEHQGETTELEVDPDESILSKALDSGMDVPHDCKLGVCMTCPAKLLTGKVDQSEGMLSDDVVERGFALLCAAYPRSDCRIRTIPEEELLALQLATAND